MKAKQMSLINLFTFIFMMVLNTLAIVLPINHLTTAQVSDSYHNLFAPAGITFAIWSIIYLLLLLFTLYQIRQAYNNNTVILKKVGWWFAISNVANGLWILAWQYLQIGISVILMLTILISLIMIHLRLNINYKQKVPQLRKFAVYVPFSIYLGWISVATIANLTAFFVALNWTGSQFMQTILTLLVIIVAMLLALAAIKLKKDVYYAGVIVWAILGIVIKRFSATPGNNLIVIGASLCLVIIVVKIVTNYLQNKQHTHTTA